MDFEGKITPKRLETIRSLVAEKGMNVTSRDFAEYEIRIIMDQACLTDEERKIVELKYIRHMKNVDVYKMLEWDSESICNAHIKRVSLLMRKTCNMIFE